MRCIFRVATFVACTEALTANQISPPILNETQAVTLAPLEGAKPTSNPPASTLIIAASTLLGVGVGDSLNLYYIGASSPKTSISVAIDIAVSPASEDDIQHDVHTKEPCNVNIISSPLGACSRLVDRLARRKQQSEELSLCIHLNRKRREGHVKRNSSLQGIRCGGGPLEPIDKKIGGRY